MLVCLVRLWVKKSAQAKYVMRVFNSTKEDTKHQSLRFRFSKILTNLSFHVVVLQRTADSKLTCGTWLCTLNLLFGHVFMDVAIAWFD